MVGLGPGSRTLPALGLLVALVAVLGTAVFGWSLGAGGVPVALGIFAAAVAVGVVVVWRRG